MTQGRVRGKSTTSASPLKRSAFSAERGMCRGKKKTEGEAPQGIISSRVEKMFDRERKKTMR